MKKMYVLPYRQGSSGARTIAKGLDAKQLKLQGSVWKPGGNKLVINWGNTDSPIQLGGQVLNTPSKVSQAVNKLDAFRKLEAAGVPVPKFTDSIHEAAKWFMADKVVVFCRTMLRASEGKGIIIAETAAELVPAPLYTLRVFKDKEYRIHVFKGQVIDIAQKKLRNGEKEREGRNRYVRSHNNGWVFAHEGVECSDAVRETAINAVKALELDFGAVDIAVTKKGKPYVFEVNTAPGLENQKTIDAYLHAIQQYKQEQEKQNVKVAPRTN